MPSVATLENPPPRPAARLAVGGLTPHTTIDYPGRLSAVVYCRGCPWRCGYCHNASLQSPEAHSADTWTPVRDFLNRRRGLLDAVVFSGGEPTSQKALFDAIADVGALGFEIGLHTAGPYPNRLHRLLPLLDWVGMDIKAPFNRYEAITRVPGSGDRAFASARAILDSGIAYEFRTTLDLTLLSRDDIVRLTESLADLGVRNFALQRARDATRRPTASWLDDVTIGRIESCFVNFELRS